MSGRSFTLHSHFDLTNPLATQARHLHHVDDTPALLEGVNDRRVELLLGLLELLFESFHITDGTDEVASSHGSSFADHETTIALACSNHKWSCDKLVAEHPIEHHGGPVTKHALYRFYNDSGQLLYTGITNDPPRRMGQHADSKPWWPQVRGMTVDWYDTRAMVAAAERRAIRVENPLHNIQHKPDVPRLGNYIDGMSSPDIDLYEDIAGYYRKIFRGTEDQWAVFSEGLQEAVRDGYSRPEITEAIRDVARSNDPNVHEFLPAYPGHLLDHDEVSTAMYELSLYVEAEVRKFRAIAAGEEGMERAHWHEITIRAAEIADELLEEEGRDRQTLINFLDSIPDGKGERALTQAHEEFNAHQGSHPVGRDSDEVLELAIANHMGVMVPDSKASFQTN